MTTSRTFAEQTGNAHLKNPLPTRGWRMWSRVVDGERLVPPTWTSAPPKFYWPRRRVEASCDRCDRGGCPQTWCGMYYYAELAPVIALATTWNHQVITRVEALTPVTEDPCNPWYAYPAYKAAALRVNEVYLTADAMADWGVRRVHPRPMAELLV